MQEIFWKINKFLWLCTIPLLLKFQADMPELFDSIEYDTTFDPNKYAVIKDIED